MANLFANLPQQYTPLPKWRETFLALLPSYFFPAAMSWTSGWFIDDAQLRQASTTTIAIPSFLAAALVFVILRQIHSHKLVASNQLLMTPSQLSMAPNQSLTTPNQSLTTPNQSLTTPNRFLLIISNRFYVTVAMMILAVLISTGIGLVPSFQLPIIEIAISSMIGGGITAWRYPWWKKAEKEEI